jgi:predicted phosphodiesterase
MHPTNSTRINRRAFIEAGALVICAAGTVPSFANTKDETLRVGLITDLHYADKPPAGTRFYRETLGKLAEAAEKFSNAKIDFVVELGDLIDAADSVEVELDYLKAINREFSSLSKDRHYVLGNHCVDTLTKEEFLGTIEQKKSYYSFDRGGIHFVILDACFKVGGQPYGRKNSTWTDTSIPAEELEWLEADLNANKKPVIVFAHQRLDVSTNHGVKNNASVRKVLEKPGTVLAVFQGHSHQNEVKDIAGIHYCTLVAMVEGSGKESNGYCVLNISPGGTLRVEGFRKQVNYQWR